MTYTVSSGTLNPSIPYLCVVNKTAEVKVLILVVLVVVLIHEQD